MPPAAATECERTGWTLLMMATVAPSSAAARAARWPASPAPMIRTSCAGMAKSLYTPVLAHLPAPGAARTAVRRANASGVGDRSGHRRGERAAHLLEPHDAAQALLAVDDHQGAESPQRLGAEQLLDRRVARDERLGAGVAIDD